MLTARSRSLRLSRRGRAGGLRLHRRLLQRTDFTRHSAIWPRSHLRRGTASPHDCTLNLRSRRLQAALRAAPPLRFGPAGTSSSAAALCIYAESRAFSVGDAATIIKAASARLVADAQLSTRPRNRGRLKTNIIANASNAAVNSVMSAIVSGRRSAAVGRISGVVALKVVAL